MKNLFVTIVLFFLIKYSYAQFAVVNDKDGFTNVRAEGSVKSNIIDTIRNGGYLIYNTLQGYDENINWIHVKYFKNKDKEGYVYIDNIKFLTDFKKIKGIWFSKNKKILKMDSIKITFEKDTFIVKKNKIKYDNQIYDGETYKIISKINNKDYYGTLGYMFGDELPTSQYKSIIINKGKNKIEIPKSEIENLFQPVLENNWATYDAKNDIIYIIAQNSDGAGTYFVLWIINKSKYWERLVTDGGC